MNMLHQGVCHFMAPAWSGSQRGHWLASGYVSPQSWQPQAPSSLLQPREQATPQQTESMLSDHKAEAWIACHAAGSMVEPTCILHPGKVQSHHGLQHMLVLTNQQRLTGLPHIDLRII